MFCPKCGTRTPDDADFCPSCGNDLRVLKAAPAGAAGQPVTTPAEATGASTPVPAPASPPPGAPRRGLSTGWIVAIVLGALFACGLIVGLLALVGAGTYFTVTATRTGSTTATFTPGPSAAETTVTPKGAATTDAAVDAFYKAVSSGDLTAVKRTATLEFQSQITSGMLEGRGPATTYRIIASSLPPRGGQVGDTDSVDVQESVNGVDAKTTVSFSVTKTASGWLISGIQEAQQGAAGSDQPIDQMPPAPTPEFAKAQAIETVGRFLNAQRQGNNAAMRKYVTSRYLKADPGKFQGSAAEALMQFEVVKAVQQGDVWLVTTKEQWISGPETPTYHVVNQGGIALIDDETYPK